MSQVYYHYCSLDNFVRIIQSKEIWLTNIFCMNDSAEHYWLRRVAKEVIRDRKEGADDMLESLARKLFPEEETTDLYCCCFSEDGDSLGQWRAYADDGRGVAIGIRADFLGGLYKSCPGLRVCKVEYDRAKQEGIVERVIERAKESADFPHFDQKAPGSFRDGLSPDLFACAGKALLWFYAVRCKNPCFRQEREIRLIYDPSMVERYPPRPQPPNLGERRFRPRGDTLIPYYALPLPRDGGNQAIAEVVFGPKNAWKQNKKVAHDLLSQCGYDPSKTNFRVSEATYR